jgi:hypothetical protein
VIFLFPSVGKYYKNLMIEAEPIYGGYPLVGAGLATKFGDTPITF